MKYIRGIFIALIAIIICLGLYKYFAFPFLESDLKQINLRYEQNQLYKKAYQEGVFYTGGTYGNRLIFLITQKELDQIKNNIYTFRSGGERKIIDYGAFCYEDIKRKNYNDEERVLKEILLRNEECLRQGITEDMPIRVDIIEYLQQLRDLKNQYFKEFENTQSKYPLYYILTNYYNRENAVTWLLLLGGVWILTEGSFYYFRKTRYTLK